MNKKGFTLVELIAVVTIIAIVALIATPNIIKMVDNGRKEQILADGKSFLSDVKQKSKLIKYEEFYPIEGECSEICAKDSSFENVLNTDPDGNEYDKDLSCVEVCKNSGNYTYKIKLVSVNDSDLKVRGISTNKKTLEYVLEDELDKDSVVKFK